MEEQNELQIPLRLFAVAFLDLRAVCVEACCIRFEGPKLGVLRLVE